MERLVEIDKSDTDALVDHAVAEGVKRGLLMAAGMAEAEAARILDDLDGSPLQSYNDDEKKAQAWLFSQHAKSLRAKAAE